MGAIFFFFSFGAASPGPASPVIGQWANVIMCQSSNARIDL